MPMKNSRRSGFRSAESTPTAVKELLNQLTEWAFVTRWVDWLEVGGSLGRGAADELSDIDTGIGVVEDGISISDRVAEALAAAREFSPVADSIVQDLDGRAHLIVVFEDGRQLSLVVVAASVRTGLPPQSLAVLDRTDRLATMLPGSRWEPSAETARDWSFDAWIGLGDAARHALRGHPWRALRSLTEARDLAWQLWAAREGVTYPGFGAVSVENAGLAGPAGMAPTHPASLAPVALFDAVDALATILEGLTEAHDVGGVARVVLARIRQLRERL
jgi:hypothetical protein